MQCCKLKLRYLEYKNIGDVQQNIIRCIKFYEFITSNVRSSTFPIHLRNLRVIAKLYHGYIRHIKTEILPTVEVHIFNLQDIPSCGPTVFRYSHNCTSKIFRVIQAVEELPVFCRTRAAFTEYTWPLELEIYGQNLISAWKMNIDMGQVK